MAHQPTKQRYSSMPAAELLQAPQPQRGYQPVEYQSFHQQRRAEENVLGIQASQDGGYAGIPPSWEYHALEAQFNPGAPFQDPTWNYQQVPNFPVQMPAQILAQHQPNHGFSQSPQQAGPTTFRHIYSDATTQSEIPGPRDYGQSSGAVDMGANVPEAPASRPQFTFQPEFDPCSHSALEGQAYGQCQPQGLFTGSGSEAEPCIGQAMTPTVPKKRPRTDYGLLEDPDMDNWSYKRRPRSKIPQASTMERQADEGHDRIAPKYTSRTICGIEVEIEQFRKMLSAPEQQGTVMPFNADKLWTCPDVSCVHRSARLGLKFRAVMSHIFSFHRDDEQDILLPALLAALLRRCGKTITVYDEQSAGRRPLEEAAAPHTGDWEPGQRKERSRAKDRSDTSDSAAPVWHCPFIRRECFGDLGAGFWSAYTACAHIDRFHPSDAPALRQDIDAIFGSAGLQASSYADQPAVWACPVQDCKEPCGSRDLLSGHVKQAHPGSQFELLASIEARWPTCERNGRFKCPVNGCKEPAKTCGYEMAWHIEEEHEDHPEGPDSLIEKLYQ